MRIALSFWYWPAQGAAARGRGLAPTDRHADGPLAKERCLLARSLAVAVLAASRRSQTNLGAVPQARNRFGEPPVSARARVHRVLNALHPHWVIHELPRCQQVPSVLCVRGGSACGASVVVVVDGPSPYLETTLRLVRRIWARMVCRMPLVTSLCPELLWRWLTYGPPRHSSCFLQDTSS